jgi:hypothetical protein
MNLTVSLKWVLDEKRAPNEIEIQTMKTGETTQEIREMRTYIEQWGNGDCVKCGMMGV